MSGFHCILLRTWVTSLGENEEQIDHISKGGHWSLGHAALIPFYDLLCQTYGNIVVSWFLLSLSFCSRQCGLHLKSVYEAGWVSGDASLCLFTEPEDCLFSLLLPLDTLLKWLKTFTTMGIFFHENTGHLAEPLGRHWAFQNQHLISFHEVS